MPPSHGRAPPTAGSGPRHVPLVCEAPCYRRCASHSRTGHTSAHLTCLSVAAREPRRMMAGVGGSMLDSQMLGGRDSGETASKTSRGAVMRSAGPEVHLIDTLRCRPNSSLERSVTREGHIKGSCGRGGFDFNIPAHRHAVVRYQGCSRRGRNRFCAFAGVGHRSINIGRSHDVERCDCERSTTVGLVFCFYSRCCKSCQRLRRDDQWWSRLSRYVLDLNLASVHADIQWGS